MGAVDIPAFLLCMFLMQWKRTGRRWTGCLGLTGAGISSFLCIPMIIYSEFLFASVGSFQNVGEYDFAVILGVLRVTTLRQIYCGYVDSTLQHVDVLVLLLYPLEGCKVL